MTSKETPGGVPTLVGTEPGEEVIIRIISWWTMGESNSRTSGANRVHYHYANGPNGELRNWNFELSGEDRQHVKQPQHT